MTGERALARLVQAQRFTGIGEIGELPPRGVEDTDHPGIVEIGELGELPPRREWKTPTTQEKGT